MMANSLEGLEVLQLAEEVADEIWKLVSNWKNFERQTIGTQIVRAVDSIGANIAEVYGRYHYGEKLQFLYYARGSLFETKYWVNRGAKRGLIPVETAQQYAEKLSNTARQINAFARYLKSKRSQIRNSEKVLRENHVQYTTASFVDTPIFNEDDLTSLSSIFKSQ